LEKGWDGSKKRWSKIEGPTVTRDLVEQERQSQKATFTKVDLARRWEAVSNARRGTCQGQKNSQVIVPAERDTLCGPLLRWKENSGKEKGRMGECSVESGQHSTAEELRFRGILHGPKEKDLKRGEYDFGYTHKNVYWGKRRNWVPHPPQ